MIRELLRKDWRVYRDAIIGGAVVAACPYAVLLPLQALYPPGGGNTRLTYGLELERAAIGGLVLTLLMAAVFGAIAFAAERRERSAEFVALLPVRRGPAVLSKLLVAVSYLLLMACVHACVGWVAAGWRSEAMRLPATLVSTDSAVMLASAGVLMFGLAWMLSVYLQSPAVAASVAIGVALALMIVVGGLVELPNVRRGVINNRSTAVAVVSVAVGGLAFLVSTAHYVRRVSP